MSDTLLKRLYEDYGGDMEVIMANKDVVDRMLMVDHMRLMIKNNMSGDFKWWRMDPSDLADLIICGILNDSVGLSAKMFTNVTNITQTTDDNESCVEFHFYGYGIVGGIHIMLLEGNIYVVYDVTYKNMECSTMWFVPYDVILESKGLS